MANANVEEQLIVSPNGEVVNPLSFEELAKAYKASKDEAARWHAFRDKVGEALTNLGGFGLGSKLDDREKGLSIKASIYLTKEIAERLEADGLGEVVSNPRESVSFDLMVSVYKKWQKIAPAKAQAVDRIIADLKRSYEIEVKESTDYLCLGCGKNVGPGEGYLHGQGVCAP